MNIGIDVDDTLSKTTKPLTSHLENSLNFSKYFSKNELNDVLQKIMTGEIQRNHVTDLGIDFLNLYKNLEIQEDAVSTIEELKNLGHNIYIITARDDLFVEDPYSITKYWLDKNNVNYNNLFCYTNEKLATCSKLSIDLMIDDNVKVCELLNDNGINTLLFNSDLNKDYLTPLKRVNNWLEVKSNVSSFNWSD